MKLVVDNSVAMRWLFNDGTAADRLYAGKVAALVESVQVCVPALFVAEAANVISKAVKAKVISKMEAVSHFEIIQAMQAKVIAPDGLLDVRSIALRALEDGLSAYDASYLLLAEALACPLATLDKDLRKAAKKRGIAIAGI